jgi:hypothetical protein
VSTLGCSIFGYYFIESLHQAAADGDGNGMLCLEESHAYLMDPVIEWRPDQVPQLFTQRAGPLDFVRAGSGNMEEPATLYDMPMGGEQLVTCGGGADGSPFRVAFLVLGFFGCLLLLRVRASGALVLALAITLSGCGAQARFARGVDGPDLPEYAAPVRVASLSGMRIFRMPASIGARAGVLTPVGASSAPYDAGPSIGAWLALGEGLIRVEGAIDAAFISGRRVDITSTHISWQVDAVACFGRERPVSYLVFLGGRRYVDYVDAYFTRYSYAEEAYGLGLGAGVRWHIGTRSLETRVSYDAFLTSTNLGGAVSLTAGFGF